MQQENSELLTMREKYKEIDKQNEELKKENQFIR